MEPLPDLGSSEIPVITSSIPTPQETPLFLGQDTSNLNISPENVPAFQNIVNSAINTLSATPTSQPIPATLLNALRTNSSSATLLNAFNNSSSATRGKEKSGWLMPIVIGVVLFICSLCSSLMSIFYAMKST